MMFERFTADARDVVVAAQSHARAMHHGWIGTEHLMLGLFGDADGRAARILAGRGVGVETLSADVERVVGRGEPDIDADALATIGIDLDEVRSRVERTFGVGALARRRCRRGGAAASVLPFTPRAKKVLELALREAIALGDRHIGSEHVLLGLLRAEDGVAGRILRAHGVECADVRDEVARRAAG